MRILATLESEPQAHGFVDVLHHEGIESRAEPGPEGFEVWVYDEEELGRSRELLEVFRANPEDPRFAEARGAASAHLRKQARDAQAAKRQYVDVRTRVFHQSSSDGGPVTRWLIGICVVVAVLTGLKMRGIAPWLTITPIFFEEGFYRYTPLLTSLASGQVWRLVTPALLHFSLMHIAFNMIWLYQLGSLIEHRLGSRFFVLFAVVTAIGSNLLQYWWNGPSFGGMSGVVYGLLGFVWAKGRYDPTSRLHVAQGTMGFMMVWLLLGFTGLLGGIANGAHLGGLVIGVAWGFLGSPGSLQRLMTGRGW